MFKNKTKLAMPTSFAITMMALFITTCLIVGIPITNVKNNTNAKDLTLQNKVNPSTITSNTYTGTGAPLNLQEWADSKNTTTSRSLIGSGTTGTDIQLGAGWSGYKIYTNLYNLYDTKEWANYTGMPYDGTSNTVNNGVWNFLTHTGTYLATGQDGAAAGANDVYVSLNPHWDGTYSNFYYNSNGWWQQIFSLPRGTIVAMWVAYSYCLVNNATSGGYAFGNWAQLQSFAAVNGTKDGGNAYNLTAPNMNAGGTQNVWHDTGVQAVPSAVITSINTLAGGQSCKINFSVGLMSTQQFGCSPRCSAFIQFKNCRIFIEANAKPTQANLQIAFSGAGGNSAAKNNIQNIGTTTYGSGQLNYSATPTPWQATGGTNLDIVSTITTSETQNYPSDNLENVQFNMYQIIYGSHYRNTQIGASSLAANGTAFVSANNSKVNWTMYFYDRPPQITGNQQNYADYLFNGSKPADWQVYSVLDSQPYNTTKNLIGSLPANTSKWLNGSTFITMPKAYAGYYGYWTFSAWSPNYVQSMAVPSSIYQGKSLRINGTIMASSLTDKYVGSTKAMLTIEFPNGTAWASATELASVTNRQITFPAITIPSSGSNYVAGTYTAILTWNNTRSGYPLNETGCIVRTFTVFHNATLTPQYTTYLNNLNTQTALPIELRYVDTGSNDISGASITFTNFNSVTQNFTHISGYYNYLTLLNCTKGNNGLNTITITATSSSYQPVTLNIKVEVVRTTNFTIDQYPSVTCQWNDNFSLTLHYKDAKLGTGIGISSKNNITVTWPQEVGKYYINMAQNSSGIFTLVFNTTGTTPNTIYSVPITIKQLGYQNQTVTMSITINPRLTYFNLVPISSISYGSMMNVSGTYKEISSGNLISNKTNSIRVYAWITSGPNCTVANVGGTTKTTFTFAMNTSLLSVLGTYTLNVNIRWKGQPYYQNQTSTLQFSVVQRPTTLTYGSLQPTPLYQPVTFTITYVDTATGTGVYKNVLVSKITAGVTLTSAVYQGSGVYAITLTNAGLLTYGSHNVVFNFNITTSVAPYYANNTITVTVQITTRSTQIVYSGLVPTSYGQQFDFTVQVQDVLNGTSITGIGASSFSSNASTNFKMYSESPAGTYHIHVNTTQLSNVGSVKYWINVVPGSVTKYSNANSTITFTVVNRAVSLSAGSVPVTNFGQLITFKIQYSDGINSTGLISHVTFWANWTGYQFPSLGGGLYNFSIPASDFSALGSYGVNITATWSSSTKPFYAYAQIVVKFTITNRASTLTASKESNPQFGDNMTIDITFQDGINSSYININRVTQLSVSVVGNNGSVTMVRTGTNGVYKVYIATKNLPGTGSYTVSITASWSGKPFYSSQTQTLSVTVSQRTDQVSYSSLAPTAYLNNFTFTINFMDGSNSSLISGASISANITHKTHITWSMASAGHYSVSINTTEVRGTVGSSYVIIYVNASINKPYYANNQITILLTVTQRSTTLSYSSLQPTPLYQPVSFAITYIDSSTSIGVHTNVAVTTPTSGVSIISAVYQGNGIYAISITNTGWLVAGSYPVKFNFNITTSTAPFYANNTITITVQITTRSTQILYSGLVPTSYGQPYDFTVQVKDTNGTIISGLGSGAFTSNATFKMYSESPVGTYHIQINTTLQTKVGSVKYWINVIPTPTTKYSSANLTITFTAVNRAVSLSVGSVPVTNFGQLITFSVQYSDGINGTGLTSHVTFGANWTGYQFPSLGGGLYNFSIPASDFTKLGSYGVNITATWQSLTKPFYAYAQIVVKFTITNRASTLTASKESNSQFGDNMTIDITFQDGINSSYININRVTQLSVSVSGNGFTNGTLTMVRIGSNGVYKVYIATVKLSVTGIYTVSITTSWTGKPFYVNQTQILTVTVTQRSSVLSLANPSQVYTTYGYNVPFTVSLGYLDVENGSTISKTSAVIRRVSAYHGGNVTTITNGNTPITYSPATGWTVNFNSANFVAVGNTYLVTVQFNWSATKPFYTNDTISFNISISVAQTQLAEIGSLTAQKGQNQTLYFEYINSQSGSPISPSPAPAINITVKVPGVGSVSNNTSKLYYTTGGKRYVIWNGTAAWNGTCYKLTFNATILGPLTPFNILFTKGNKYNQVNSNYTLVDTSLGSQLQLVSVQSNRILGQSISIAVAYTYQGTSGAILGATGTVANNVTSLYWGKIEYSFTYISSSGNYNLTILNTGPSYRISTTNFYTIYVTMNATTTANATVNVQFQMQQIPTNISKVLFNKKDYTSNATYSTQITKSINITVEFDQLYPSTANITTAKVVYLMSSSLSSNINFTLVGGRWSLILPASKLGVGTAFLFVIAQKTNYAQSSKTLQITVTQVSTTLAVYMNGTNILQRPSFTVNWGQYINVSALYKNTVDNVNITDAAASVTLTGGSHGSTFTLTTLGNWWRIAGNLASQTLGTPASYTMTLSASRANFTTSSAVFTIVVIQVPTTLKSIYGVNNNSITVNWSATFTIGLNYTDSNNAVIKGAQLTSSPTGNITGHFTSPTYYLQYNSSNFGPPQVYNLVISIVKGNYTSASITFSVTVNSIPTTLKTYVNNGPASTNFVVNWSNTVTIVAQYRDVMHVKFITGASISAGSFTKAIISQTYLSGNYTLTFNSTLLGVPGVYIISLTFSKANYTTTIAAITIQVANPATTLIPLTTGGKSLTTQLTLYYGQSFIFVVKMHDNVHNANLTGWTGTTNPTASSSVQNGQNWTFTYNGLLPGIHTITVTGSKTNFTSASLVITVQVNSVQTTLLSYAYKGGSSSSFSVQWGSQIGVTVYYEVTQPNSSVISPASAVITTTYASNLLGSPITNAQNTTFMYNASKFVPGVYTITLAGNRSYYAYASLTITMTVSSMATTLATIDSTTHANSTTFTATWGTTASFDIAYNQTSTLNSFALISNVITTSPAYTSTAADKGRLVVNFDTSKFAAGIYSITINAQYANRTSQSTYVSLTITPVSTSIVAYNSSNVVTTTYNVYWNNQLSIDVLYQAANGTSLTTLSGTTVVSSPYTPVLQGSSSHAGRLNLTFSTSALAIQIYQITFTASRANFATASMSVLVNVMQRPSNVTVYNIDEVKNSSYTVYWGDILVVNVLYADSLNATSLSILSGTTISSTPAFSSSGENIPYKQLQLQFDTTTYAPNFYSIVISCSRNNYASSQAVVLLNILPVPTAITTYNGSIATSSFTATWNTTFTISVQYSRTYAPASIAGATIKTNYPYVSMSYSSGKYLITYNSTKIGSPSIYTITFTANKTNFVSITTSVSLQVLQVNTVAHSYALGGGLQSQFTVPWGMNLTFTVRYYLASLPNTALLPTSVTKTSFPGTVTLGNLLNENITMTVNSTKFGGTGVFTSTFLISRTNYTQNSILVTIVVNQRSSTLHVYNTTGTESYSYNVYWGDSLSVNVLYADGVNGSSLSNMIGTTISSSIASTSSSKSPYLQLTFNTAPLGQGLQSIVISCSRNNYVSGQIAVLMNVLPVPTNVTTYNYTTGITNSQFKATWNTLFNISVQFYRTYKVASLAVAIIQANPLNVSYYYVSGKYVFTFNASRIGSPGIYSITFTASMTNFVTSAVSVTLQVLTVNTVLQSYVHNGGRQSQFSIEWGKNLTFTVQYQLASAPFTALHPTSVSSSNFPGMILLGSGNNQNITMTVNGSAFGGTGVFTPTFILSRTNYTQNSMQVTIQVVTLQTRVNIDLNSTTSPSSTNITGTWDFYVPFQNNITIQVQYLTQAGAPISKARVMIRFIEGSRNWTNYPAGNNTIKNMTLGVYALTLNTTKDLGDYNQYSFVVVISRANYTIQSQPFYVYPLKRQTKMNIYDSNWNLVYTGQKFSINYTRTFVMYCSLIDLSTGKSILNANYTAVMKGVTYVPSTSYTNTTGAAKFVFNSSRINLDVGTSNYISVSGTAGFYNPSGGAINLEVLTVPTNLTLSRYYGIGNVTTITGSIMENITWSGNVTLRVYFYNMLNSSNITKPTIQALIGTLPPISGSWNGAGHYSTIVIDTTSLSGGNTYTVFVSGYMQNYTSAQFPFNLHVNLGPAKISAMNDTHQFNNGDLLKVYYGDVLSLNFTYKDLLNNHNINYTDAGGVSIIHAIVLGTTIDAIYQSNGKWMISIATSTIIGLQAGSTPQVLITGSYPNFEQQVFSFNMQVLNIPTALVIPIALQNVVHYTWGQSFNFTVGYNDTHNEMLISGTLVANYPAQISYIGSNFTLVFNTTLIGSPGIYRITLTANKTNYAPASYTITVQIGEVPTSMQVLFNGATFLSVALKQNVTIMINYTRTDTHVGIYNPHIVVTVNFTNDLTNALVGYSSKTLQIQNNSNGLYWVVINLDLKTFLAEPKFVIVQAYLENYSLGKANPVIYLKPIDIVPSQNLNKNNPKDMNIPDLTPGSTVTFDFTMLDNSTGSGFTDVNQIRANITCSTLNIFNEPMRSLGDGTFEYSLTLPNVYNATYTVTVEVYVGNGTLARQFNFQNEYTFHFSTMASRQGQDLTWLVISLIIGIIVIAAWFILYQVRFKYPPIIRKIHDLQRSVRRGKAAAKIPSQKVSSREEGIYSEFAKILNEYSFLQTRAKSMAASAKKEKAAKGYVAPEDKDTLAKEFDLSTAEKVVEIKSVAPAIMPKEGPKKYVELPTAPAPIAPPTEEEEQEPVAKPAAPKMPGIAKLGALKPPTLAVIPKPTAKPMPKQGAVVPSEGEGQEGLYGELVKLEQKKYKAQRSLRDLKAKKEKGILTDEEFKQYEAKFEEALEKINEKISEIRRKLVNF